MTKVFEHVLIIWQNVRQSWWMAHPNTVEAFRAKEGGMVKNNAARGYTQLLIMRALPPYLRVGASVS